MREPPVTISHVGFKVVDMNKMVDFYTRIFGLHVSDRAHDDRMAFLSGDPADHHQIFFVQGRKPEDKETHFSHVAFRVRDLKMLRDIHKKLKTESEVSELRTGTHGNAWSVYFHDPEGNAAEAFVDTPWHVAQPFFKPVEDLLEKSDTELKAWTDQMLNEYPTKRDFDAWRQDFAKTLGID